MRKLTIPSLLIMLGALFGTASAQGVRFQSTSPGASEADAVQQAIDEAAGTLVPAVRQRVDLLLKQQRFMPASPDEATLKQIIATGLREGSAIGARSVDKQSRPYGDVYYATLELKTGGKWLDDMARRGINIARGERQRVVRATAAGTGWLLTIYCTYFAANAFTKGYYRTRLRLAALTAAVVGTAAVATAAGMLPTHHFAASHSTVEHAWQN